MSDKLKAAAASLIAAADAFSKELDVAQEGKPAAPMTLIMALACEESESITVVSAGDELELLKLALFLRAHFAGEIDPADVQPRPH